jgi:hypothetical protein
MALTPAQVKASIQAQVNALNTTANKIQNKNLSTQVRQVAMALAVLATDAGNLGPPPTPTPTPPPAPLTNTFTVDSPAPNAVVTGQVAVTGQCGSQWKTIAAFDANWNKVGQDIHPTGSTYSLPVDTTLVPNGAATLQIMAFDTDSGITPANTAVLDLAVNVNNAAPAPAARTPAAVQNSGWNRVKEWRFGTDPGNTVAQLTDLIADGWTANSGHLNNEVQTYNNDQTNGNQNFVAAPDHCSIVARYNGGTIGVGTDAVSSLAVDYATDKAGFTAPTRGYFEATIRIPKVSGEWAAWWMVGWSPQNQWFTWGPEIDMAEFTGTQTEISYSALHVSANPSYCFTSSGQPPGGTAESPNAAYEFPGWNWGDLKYAPPGGDFSVGFHTFGVKFRDDNKQELWIDDVAVGTYDSTQYCDDGGNPVIPYLELNLAMGDGGGSVNPADFGDNTVAGGNKFHFDIQNVQLWRP